MKQSLYSCPNCSNMDLIYDGVKKYQCPECGWEFYQNTAAAVAGIIEFQGRVLAVKRNQEPGKGMLDFPGGFVDPMESAEEALRREIKEELHIELRELEYLCSAPNIYHYKGIEYSTCDVFFIAQIDKEILKFEESEIASYYWYDKSELDADKFAFRSMKEGIKAYLNRIG
jgi:NADH pyrophosphatase NudC (nudix superfamily)